MGKYLSPTLEQVQNAEIKCAVIWYPSDDGLFFQQAVRGALADLRFAYNWEGSDLLTRAIAERFTETDLRTDGTFFVKDCETLDEALDEDGTMAINVTVNQECGGGCGCSGGGKYIIPDYPNETELVIPTVPIVPPTIPDENFVPDGFTDRADFDEYRCAYATQLVDDFSESVGNLQVISGLTVTASAAALMSLLFQASTYSAVVAGLVAAGVSVTGGLILLGGAMAALVGFGAVAYDKFNDIHDELVLMREQFICEVFNASDIAAARQIFIDRYGLAVTNLGLDDGLTASLANIVESIIDALIPSEILLGLFELYKDFGVSDFDCSSCSSVAGTAVFTFDADEEGWANGLGRASYDGTLQLLTAHGKSGNTPDPAYWTLQRDELNVKAGLDPNLAVQIDSLTFDILQGSLGDSMADGKTVKIQLRFEDATTWTSPDINVYGQYTLSGAPQKELRSSAGGDFAILVYHYSNGSGANSNIHYDNFNIGLSSV